MRIIHIAPAVSNIGGGISDVVINLSEAQSNDGNHVLVFGGGKLDTKSSYKFEYRILNLWTMFYLIRILSINSNYKVIIHGAWSITFFYIMIVHIFIRFNYVYQPHGLLSIYRYYAKSKLKKMLAWRVYQNYIFKHASSILVTSTIEDNELSWAKTEHTVINILSIGVSSLFFSSPKNEFNACSNLLFISQITPIKGIEYLLKAIAKISNEYNQKICLDIYGYGSEKYIIYLKLLAKSLFISEQINFKGKVSPNDRALIYDKYSVFVLPSRNESFGLVVAEALIRGCYVITTSGTPWEESDRYLLDVIDLDVQNLVDAILEAYDLSLDQRVNFRNYSFEEFRWENISKKLNNIL
jgi:glycosyltransferase involved in cell wall biosynthesis